MYTGKISASLQNDRLGEDTHDALVSYIRIPLQMEQHGHVVLVIRSIKARDVDQGAAQAVSKILCIKCWLPVITKVDCLPGAVRVLYPEVIPAKGRICEREKGDDGKEERRPRPNARGRVEKSHWRVATLVAYFLRFNKDMGMYYHIEFI